MGLREEVAASSRPPRNRCSVCVFIESRPDSEQAEWDEVMGTTVEEFTHVAIYRAMMRRGFSGISVNPIVNHRTARHRT